MKRSANVAGARRRARGAARRVESDAPTAVDAAAAGGNV